MKFRLRILGHDRHTDTYIYIFLAYYTFPTRKMVPITGRARSFLLFLDFTKQNRDEGGQNKNNRPINLPKVITFSTDYKYTI